MADAADDLLEREVELSADRTLYIADNVALEDEAGATTWDCGLVLAHYLIKQHEMGRCPVSGRRVIELGAGTGVVGLTAAALGAQQVVLTDKEHLLPLLQRNIKRNDLQSNAEVVALTWGEQLPGCLQPPYDVILCSDLVYSSASVQPLLSTLSTLMGPDSTVLYACEFREGAGLEQLHQQLPAYRLKEQLLPYTELHEEWCSPDILVWLTKNVPA